MTDWEAVERDYRAGLLSIREIGRQHDLSDTAIRKRAREGNWERDLEQRVKAAARAKLARAEAVAQASAMVTTDPISEREIVQHAASVVVDVVRQHRRQLSQGRALVDALFEQLAEAIVCRDEIEATIDDDESVSPQRKLQMLKAVSLPAHATILRDLSGALQRLIPLEREAFGIDNAPEEKTVEADARVVTDYAELRRRFIADKHAAG